MLENDAGWHNAASCAGQGKRVQGQGVTACAVLFDTSETAVTGYREAEIKATAKFDGMGLHYAWLVNSNLLPCQMRAMTNTILRNPQGIYDSVLRILKNVETRWKERTTWGAKNHTPKLERAYFLEKNRKKS